jgi:serine/threonine protein kinase
VPSSSLAANTFALKTFTDEHAEDYYRNEVEAFRSLQVLSDINLVSYYGSYTHGSTYNIILEYVDKGTLETYFENEVPPTKGEDIINFWGGIFMIFKALSAIHDLEMTNKTQSLQQYVC